MKFCAKCGTKASESQKFCSKCGAPVNNNANNGATTNTNANTRPNAATNGSANTGANTGTSANVGTNPNASANRGANPSTAGNPNVNGSNNGRPTNPAVNNGRPTNPGVNNGRPNNPGVNNSIPRNTNVAPRKPIDKKLIIIPSVIIGVLAVLIICTKVYFTKKYTPQNVISNFQKAVLSNDAKSLQDLLYCADKSLEITEDDATAIIKFLTDDSSNLTEVVTSLNQDIAFLSNINIEGTPVMLSDYELFALTMSSKNALFTKYAIMIRPLYAEIESNDLDAKIFIGDEEKAVMSKDDISVKVGPLVPGSYDITLKTTDVFGNELSETLSTNPFSLVNEYSSINFFDDYITTAISTNVEEAKVFVNGKDTGKLAKDFAESFGPLKEDDLVYLSYTANGVEYTTKERSAYSYYSYLYLDFSYNDYDKISKAIKYGSTNTTEPSETAAAYIEKYKGKDYIIANSNSVELDFKALNAYTAEELFIARNEMFARYGYVFKNSPNLQSYFESKSWYKANPSFSGELTSDIEKTNSDLIKSLEFLKMAKEKCQPITSDYVLSDSSTTLLSASTVSALNDWELVVARNEIFARYGLEFSTKELIEHFKSKSWFSINSSVGNNVPLTETENKNIATFVAEEQKRINTAVNHDLGE